VCKLGILLGREGGRGRRGEGVEEGAYVVGEPCAGGDGVVHVDVVFGGGVRHAPGDGGRTPWVWGRLERGRSGAGLLTAESFFHAAADVGRGVPVCPFREPGGASDAVELLACGCLDVGGGLWPAGVGSAYHLSCGVKIEATCPKYQS